MNTQGLLIPSNLDEIIGKANDISFIHIPKTGGSYVDSLRDQNEERIFNSLGHVCCWDPSTPELHTAWPVYDDIEKSCLELERFKKSFVFSLVRNPFDMLVSYYHHDDCAGWEGCRYDSARKFIRGSKYDFSTFESFIRAYCDEGYVWHKPALKDFLFFQIFHNSGKAMVPFVGKFEYMDVCCSMLCHAVYGDKRICMMQKPKNTATARDKKDYRVYYTSDMVRLVEKKCKRELEMFGYSFEGTDNRVMIDTRPFTYTHPIIS